jgi:hypothetical protein
MDSTDDETRERLGEILRVLKDFSSRIEVLERHQTVTSEPVQSKLEALLRQSSTVPSASTPLRREQKEREMPHSVLLSRTAQRHKLEEVLEAAEESEDTAASRNSSRRQSVFFRQISQSDEKGNRLVIHGQQPAFEHIKLATLQVWSVFDFFDKIVEYQTVHKITLPVTSLVSKAVREELISRYAPDLTLEKFHSLSHTEICLLAQDVVKPQSELAFLKSLKDNATFPDLPSTYIPSVTNFMPFYRAILIYKTRFMRVYEFLATSNEDNVPPSNYKEGGLIKLFLDALPYEFGKRMWQHINKERRDHKGKEYTIYLFLKTFTDLLQNALGIAESTRSVKELFGGTLYEKQKVPTLNVLTPHVDDAMHDKSQMPDTIEVTNPTERSLPDDESHYDTADIAMYDQYLQYAQQQQTPTSSYKPNQKSAPKQDMACFEKVFHDKCNKDNCKWSHETSVIRKARDNFETLLSKLKRPATQTAQLGVRSPPQRVSAILDRRIHESTEIATAVDNIDVPPDNCGDY